MNMFKGKEFESFRKMKRDLRLPAVIRQTDQQNLKKVIAIPKTDDEGGYFEMKSLNFELNVDYNEYNNLIAKNMGKKEIFKNSSFKMYKKADKRFFIMGNTLQPYDKFKDQRIKINPALIRYRVIFKYDVDQETRHFNINLNNNEYYDTDQILDIIYNDFLANGNYIADIMGYPADRLGVYLKSSDYNLNDFYNDDEDDMTFAYIAGYDSHIYIQIDEITERNIEYERQLIINKDEYYIRDEDPIDITKNFKFLGHDIFEYENELKKNCLVNFIENHLKYHKKDILKKLGSEPTLGQFQEIIKEYNLKCVLWNISGKILFYNNMSGENTNNKPIYAIINNNHIYSLKISRHGSGLKNLIEHNIAHLNQVTYDNVIEWNDKLAEILDGRDMPKIINMNEFQHDGTRYIYNDHEKIILKRAFNVLGLESDSSVTASTFMRKIITVIKSEQKINSFFPFDYKNSGFYYRNKNIDDDFLQKNKKNIIGIDMNKAYSSSLYNLNYLIYVHYAFNTPHKVTEEINIKDIVDHYLYIYSCSRPNMMMSDKRGVITGRLLKYIIKNDIVKKENYKILEYIEAQTVDNYYKDILKKAYEKYDKDLYTFFKHAFNIHIGKFQTTNDIKGTTKKNLRILTTEALKHESIMSDEINNKYSIAYDEEAYNFKYNGFNNLPISYQIIEECKIKIYEKIYDLGIKLEDLIQVKVDAIVFLNKDNKYKINKDYYSKKGFLNTWSIENDINFINRSSIAKDSDITFFKNDTHDIFNESQVKIFNQYAGGGKSYNIINNLIPKLDNNYIVMACMHSTLKQYRELGLKCNTIDHYIKSKCRNIEEDNIIIDEHGLLKPHHIDFLIKLKSQEKNIYMYGDNQQLQPPMSTFGGVKTHFLKSFGKYDDSWTNHRNKFTGKQYERFIKGNVDQNEINLLLNMYMVDFDDAENYICYRNSTLEEMRKKYLNKINKRFDIDEISDGLKIVSITKEYNIGMTYTTRNNNGKIDIIDDEGNIKSYCKSIILNNFRLNNVMNLYQAQGQTLNNIYYDQTDKYFLTSIPGALYTLLSRVIEKI